MSDVAEAVTLHLERLIPMLPNLLFELWTQPAQLASWWAPDGYQAFVRELDLRPGGRWRVVMRHADGAEVETSGVYTVVEPPRRLAFTWAWVGPDGVRSHETEVTVTFERAPGGSRLVLLQRRFESSTARNNHARGWSACLERMVAIAGCEGRNAQHG